VSTLGRLLVHTLHTPFLHPLPINPFFTHMVGCVLLRAAGLQPNLTLSRELDST